MTVRTETFARPPYSGATYYFYERAGQTICTKLAVCNKYDHCSVSYTAGAFKDDQDKASRAASTSRPAVIPTRTLRKHVCLIRFGLVGPAR